MKLKEIANDVEQRRIEMLKKNAERAKKLVRDAQARAKIRKAQQQLMKPESGESKYSLNG
jgi:16S rRNA C967 or C1407 C5-methylase (RsmB/RsmF family)